MKTIYTQLYGIKYSYLIQIICMQIYLIETGTTSPDQSGPGSIGNEEVLHIPHSSRTGIAPPDAV